MGVSLTVPPFDVIIDGQGYIFADLEHDKALYGNTSTFVPRQNIQGNYGDNQQDAWLTVSQNDWSGGEQQKHYRGNDEERSRKYWRGKNVDTKIPGQVSLPAALDSITFAAAPKTAHTVSSGLAYASTSTTLYSVSYDGTIASIGAHGLGAAPSRFGLAADPSNRYLTTTTAGTVGVRRENAGVFSTFSATAADSLAFLNNALYGYSEATGSLLRYSTAGVATVLFTWQDSTGGGAGVPSKIMAFGGKLLILRYRTAGPRGAELWLYDGVAPAKVTEFPETFNPYEMEFSGSTVYISGVYEKHTVSSANIYQKPVIYFYRDGEQDVFWRGEQYLDAASTVIAPAMAAFDEGLLFTDLVGFPTPGTSRLVFYDQTEASFSTIAEQAFALDKGILVAAASFALLIPNVNDTAGYVYPDYTVFATTAEVDSSLIDFDSSLPKVFRGIKVVFDAGGGTSSVDILYRVNDLAGSYTSLQTGATSGVEYLISTPAEGTTYQAISVRAKLNKGNSAAGPILKRWAVRGVPVLPAYKKRTYVLILGGKDGESHVKLRDGTLHALDGKQMALNLQTAAGRTSPFTIEDCLGPFTGRIDEGGLEMVQVKPEQWIARVKVREV